MRSSGNGSIREDPSKAQGCQGFTALFFWERGDYRGGEIGRVFGLGESSVSRRARMAKDKLEKDGKVRTRFEKIKSLINVPFNG